MMRRPIILALLTPWVLWSTFEEVTVNPWAKPSPPTARLMEVFETRTACERAAAPLIKIVQQQTKSASGDPKRADLRDGVVFDDPGFRMTTIRYRCLPSGTPPPGYYSTP